jgi:hypothetical protein
VKFAVEFAWRAAAALSAQRLIERLAWTVIRCFWFELSRRIYEHTRLHFIAFDLARFCCSASFGRRIDENEQHCRRRYCRFCSRLNR